MITIISGTNRPGSNTRKVTAHIEAVYKSLGVPFQLLDLAHLPPREFSRPRPTRKSPPPSRNSPMLFSPPTAWSLSRPRIQRRHSRHPEVLLQTYLPFPESFEHRPVCFGGRSLPASGGALRPIEQLQAIFGYRNAFIYPDRVFMPGVHKLFNEHGHFANAELEKRLQSQADRSGFAEKLQSGKKAALIPPVVFPLASQPFAAFAFDRSRFPAQTCASWKSDFSNYSWQKLLPGPRPIPGF